MIRLVHSRTGLPPRPTPRSVAEKLALIRRVNPTWWRAIHQMVDECLDQHARGQR